MKIFFSKQSKIFLRNLDYPLESLSQVLGRIENNYIRIDAIIPVTNYLQSETTCAMAMPKKELSDNVIGILHTHPRGNILPSDSDTQAMRKLFNKRESAILITEKKGGVWIIHPYIIPVNNKITMLDSVII